MRKHRQALPSSSCHRYYYFLNYVIRLIIDFKFQSKNKHHSSCIHHGRGHYDTLAYQAWVVCVNLNGLRRLTYITRTWTSKTRTLRLLVSNVFNSSQCRARGTRLCHRLSHLAHWHEGSWLTPWTTYSSNLGQHQHLPPVPCVSPVAFLAFNPSIF